MATIRDVAQRAGVSVATVSRWLDGQKVRAAEAVRAAVDELDYRPNLSARALKTGQSGVIGVVVPDITNPFFAAIVDGLERGLSGAAYRILLASSGESAEREEEIVGDLSGRVDGFVLVPAVEQDRVPRALLGAQIPVVLLDREVHGGDTCDVVLVDNIGGARSAAEHLLALGHRRIGTINGPTDTTPGRERRDGFLQALGAAGIKVDPQLDRIGDFRERSGYILTGELMALPEPPTALFTANNLMTIGALKALQELGVEVPRTLSHLGFDDVTLGSLLRVPLTCVTRADVEQGELSMSLLLGRLRGTDNDPPRHVVLPTRLEVRSSTGPAPRDTAPPTARLIPQTGGVRKEAR